MLQKERVMWLTQQNSPKYGLQIVIKARQQDTITQQPICTQLCWKPLFSSCLRVLFLSPVWLNTDVVWLCLEWRNYNWILASSSGKSPHRVGDRCFPYLERSWTRRRGWVLRRGCVRRLLETRQAEFVASCNFKVETTRGLTRKIYECF